VLVVGARPVGLAFAAQMARHGVVSRTLEVLDCMGLAGAVEDEGIPLRRVDSTGYGTHVGHGTSDAGLAEPPLMWLSSVVDHDVPEAREPERSGS
jgi:hypothetical protein